MNVKYIRQNDIAGVEEVTRGVTLVWKVGVPIQKDNEASLCPEARGEENWEEVYPPHLTLGSGKAS